MVPGSLAGVGSPRRIIRDFYAKPFLRLDKFCFIRSASDLRKKQRLHRIYHLTRFRYMSVTAIRSVTDERRETQANPVFSPAIFILSHSSQLTSKFLY